MKKYITSTFVLLAMISANAQVSIGGKQVVEGASTILDFNSTTSNTKGIILPAVDNLTKALPNTNTPNNNGTFLFDKSESKLKMFEKNDWVLLSDTGDKTKLILNTTDESSNEQGAIIGSPTSAAKGVLILESPNKAMILPRINTPHTNVKSPYAGMMCYDTASKSLAVFDGAKWNYWK